jgi:hypothetical protein
MFFGVFCVVFTLLLPEVKGYDPDEVLAQEIREKRAERERAPASVPTN